MKPTPEQLKLAVDELSIIPHFPHAENARVALAIQLSKFVSSAHQLRWLIDVAVNAMTEWRGLPELRGLYCTRFKPADGIEANCSLPGYTPEDSETGYLLEHANVKAMESAQPRTGQMLRIGGKAN